ncbi:hypothetical protein Mro03_27710 [Microbispora rosea subsp. rosea]|nr:hypothetical protein Mro03_27710 [Microbispora rosea subsp. rosea]
MQLMTGRLRRALRATVAVVLLCVTLPALWLSPAKAAVPKPEARQQVSQAAAQVLTWTADNSMTAYKDVPATAVAGPATIVFENSMATGSTFGMTHTLTFDTSTPGYNHDVNVNIIASPYDADGGRHEIQVNLTPGKYRFFCAIPGHQMVGELVVTPGGSTDTTAPQVSANVSGEKDADGNYVGSATVTVSASDSESGVDRVEYALDNGAFTTYSAPVSVNAAGSHRVQYRATDKAGNVSPVASVSFTVVAPPAKDTTAPQASAQVAGDKDTDGNYVGSATVTVSASDGESGVDTVEYSLDSQPFAVYSKALTVDQPGAHRVSYRATDKAGNTSAVASVTFTVVVPPAKDTTAPQVSAQVAGDKDADGNYVGSATVTVSASDTESGVDKVEYALDGASFTTYSAPISVNKTGSHTVQYRATDKAGNTSPVASVSFTVVAPPAKDTTAPQVSAQVAGDKDADGNYVGSATVTVSASDGESGVDTVEYSLDGQPFGLYSAPVAVKQPGAHTVSYRATDKAGNASDVASVSFTVVSAEQKDTTPPLVSAQVAGDKDTDGNYVGSATVTVSASDTESGVDRVEYALDNGAFTTYSAPVSVNAAGSHRVQYRATDKAGNVSPVASVSFTVVAPPAKDTTAPQASAQVAGDKDTDGNYVGSATVTVSASDGESGVDTVEYSLDSQPFAVYSKALTVDQPGAHRVSYRATDKAGNTSAVASVTFTVVVPPAKDTTAPQVSAGVSGTKDADGNYVGSATVTVSATDTESGVDKVEYALDGAAFAAYTAPVSVNKTGSHTVQYRATDKAGNTSPVGSVTFKVVAPQQDDTTAPQVSAQLSGSMDWAWNYVGSATLTISATDSGSGVATVEYSLDGQPFALYSKPVAVSQPGAHTVSYRATDKAGNTSNAGTATFSVVGAAPGSDCSKPGKGKGCTDD